MQKGLIVGAYLLGVVGLTVMAGLFVHASADRFTSPSFTIDASVGNSFGGTSDSTSYNLVSSGGEAVIGNGASGSYKMGQGYVAQLERSLQLSVQPSGLEAHYPFETVTGTRVYDNSANTIDATIPASVTRVSGKLGQALSFDGTAGVDLGNPAELQITGNQTLSMWLKPSDTTTRQNPYAKAYGGEGAIVQEIGGGLNYFYGTAGDNTTPYQAFGANSTLSTDTWTHVALVRNLNDMTLTWYINGVQDNQEAANYSAAAASSINATIGQGYVNDYKGQIDELKVFARALTPAEVKADYEANQAGLASGLSLNSITPGASQTNQLEAVVLTDGPSYGVAVSQNQDLTSGSYSIPAISGGTIASPTAWSEGTTTGLGFTLTGGLNLPVKWGSSPNYYYAALPTTDTTFYNRSGYSGGVKDVLAVQYRLDTPVDQAAGEYSNTVTYSATIIP